MEEKNDSGKLFGSLALGLLVIGFLIPFIIAMFASEDLARGFGGVAVVLAFVFGIVGWKHKTGKVTVIISTTLVLLGLVTYYGLYVGKTSARQKALQTATEAAKDAEQRTERDSQ